MEDKKVITTADDSAQEKGPLDLSTTVKAALKSVTRQEWREQEIESHNNCYLCGQKLHFTHHTDFITQDVDEEANCLHCQIRTIKQSHRLQ